MTDAEQQDPRAYFIIRGLASEMATAFSEIRFEPLFHRHPGTVSVVAEVSGDGLTGHQEIRLTLWRGYRNGTDDNDGAKGTWLRIDELLVDRTGDWVQEVIPGAAGLGLRLPVSGGREEVLLEGIESMLILLNTAIPVHRGQPDKDLVFAALNQTLEEGFEDSDNPVSELEQLCMDSDLESVEFGPHAHSETASIVTRTILDLGDEIALTVWSTADGMGWIDVNGKVQRMDSPELLFPGEDQDEADTAAELAEQLAEIHEVAVAIFEDLDPREPGTAFDLLNALAYAAMNGGTETGDPNRHPWHRLADQFGEHCQLGFLAGVMLEESPFGNLNIRASTLDPMTRLRTDLQVFWKQDEEGEEPEHWLSVGTLASPAHDVDLDYTDLLAATPEAGREYILHAISHLHEMVHLAGSVLELRTEESLGFLAVRRAAGEDISETVEHELVRTVVDDTIAGLNGVARLYTGAMPA